MKNAPRSWLIAYDIADPARLGRVHRLLKRHGLKLQYSLYLIQDTKAGLQALLEQLRARIDPRADDVRAYAVPARVELTLLGRHTLPEGVLLCSTELPALLAESSSGLDRPADTQAHDETCGQSS